MSNGRPADLPFAGWATGNYPAGANPWNGTSKRTAPVNSYYEPAIQAIAQHDNYVIGSLWDAVSGLLNHIGQMVAFNWFSLGDTTPAGATGGLHIKKMQWARMDGSKSASSKRNRQGAWFMSLEDEYAGASSVGGGYILRSDNGGVTWTVVVSPTTGANPSGAQVTRFTVLPDGAIVVPQTTYTTTGNANVWVYSAASYSRTSIAHGAASDTKFTLCEQLPNVTSDGENNGALLVGQKYGAPYTTQAVYCNYNGTTWTDISSKVPASLNTGAATAYKWFSINSPGRVLVFRDKTAETKYASITDITANWNEHSSPMAAGESAQCGCYSQDINTFFLAIWTGADTRIVKSTTGTSFSSTIGTIAGHQISSMKAVGNLLIAAGVCYNGAPGYDKDLGTMWYSSDAGVTWARVPTVGGLPFTPVTGDEYWGHNVTSHIALASNENGGYQLMFYNDSSA